MLCYDLFFVSLRCYEQEILIEGLMYDIFHQWIMDAFKLLYFNNSLISFIIITSLIRKLLDKSIYFLNNAWHHFSTSYACLSHYS